jgi:hypothetical protein
MGFLPLLDADNRMDKDETDLPETRAEPPAETTKPSAGPASGTGTAAEAMMDRWFQQQLRHLYNDVVNEPLPREFLEILGKIPGGKPES